MTKRKPGASLDVESLRLGIERCDPDLLLVFYADDARLRIVNTGAPRSTPFELRGKAEISKHLRAVFGQEMPHQVKRGVVGEDRLTFWKACEYPDGSRVVVETALEVRDGKIVLQVDVVGNDIRTDRDERSTERPPTPDHNKEVNERCQRRT